MTGYKVKIGTRAQEIIEQLGDATALLEKAGEEVALPAFGRHFRDVGLKSHTGRLLRALTEKGAEGNVIRASGNILTVGVSYNAYPYFKWAMEGRGAVYAKNKKFLKFTIDGKTFFRKSVKAAPARNPLYLTQEELDAMGASIERQVLE